MEIVKECWRDFSRRLAALGPVCVAGGAVRDALMGRAPKDFDVFVLGAGFTNADREVVTGATSDLGPIDTLHFHKSEPFLAASVGWRGFVAQVMCSPHKDVDALLDSFDWNVARFAFDGDIHQRTDIANIATGKPLELHRLTFPRSSLRRGFRFSERFGMVLKQEDLLTICREIIARADAAASKDAA